MKKTFLHIATSLPVALFAVVAAVSPAYAAGSYIVDNTSETSSEFALTGNWGYWTGQGYHNDVHNTWGSVNQGKKAAYTFSVLPGTYDIAATWSVYYNRPVDAPYTVYVGGTDVGTFRVNQKNAPDDVVADGGSWENLTSVTVTENTTIKVVLSDDVAGGDTIADAVRIAWTEGGIYVDPYAPIIIDNSPSGAGFSLVGNWGYWTNQGYKGDVHNTGGSQNQGKKARFTFDVTPGVYSVAATWSAYYNRPDNAPYTLLDGETDLGTYRVNQKVAPSDFTDDGVGWKHLTEVTVTGNTLVVELTDDNVNGDAIADAVRVQRVGEPAPSAELYVTQKAMASSDIAVENQKNVPLLRFEATASDVEDVVLTKAVFEAAEGSLNTAGNYALWVDTNDDTIVDFVLEDGIASQSSQVIFRDLIGGGYVIPADATVAFEVRADIASALASNELQLRFASTDAAYIEAEDFPGNSLSGIETNGECAATCQIHVVSQVSDATLWHLVSQGSLFITNDSLPIRNRQLLGGTLSEAVLRLELHAEAEPIDVTDLQITDILASGVPTIDRLELFFEGEVTPFAQATVSGCGSDPVPATGRTYCANMENGQLVVPEGSDVDVLVRARMKSDEQGGVSGAPLQFTLASRDAVRARGANSSNDLSQNDDDATDEGEVFIGTNVAGAHQDIVGTEHVSVLAKIAAITNANPDANGTSVPTGISAIGQFKYTAAAHNNSNSGLNDVVLNHIIYTLTGNNVLVDATAFKMYNKADQTRTHNCLLLNADGTVYSGSAATVVNGSIYVQCDDLSPSVVDTEINEGEDATFVLQADILNPNTAGGAGQVSFLQVQIDSFADPALNGTFGALESHVEWIDTDFATVSPFQWIEYPETTVKSTSYNS